MIRGLEIAAAWVSVIVPGVQFSEAVPSSVCAAPAANKTQLDLLQQTDTATREVVVAGDNLQLLLFHQASDHR